jgi:hypothetical protein
MDGLDLLKRHQPSAWALPAYDLTTGKKTVTNLDAQSPSVPSRKHRHRKGH